MDQAHQVVNSNFSSVTPNSNLSSVTPVKRKRGRPRKGRILHHAESVPMPPGFEGVNLSQVHPRESPDDSLASIVGQTVMGFVEAAFDAGYLLNVRIGNSNAILRGIAFKPGHFIPVTARNDIAPNVQMISRNEVCFPTEDATWLKRTNQQHKHSSQITSLAIHKCKNVSLATAPSVPAVGARGTVVPVVLEPVNLSKGSASYNQSPSGAMQSPQGMPFRDKDVKTVVPLAVLPADSTPIRQEDTASLQQLFIDQVTPKSVQKENGSLSQGQGNSEVTEAEQAKSVETTPSVAVESGSESLDREQSKIAACKQSAEVFPGVIPEPGVGDIKWSLSSESLRTLHPNLHGQSLSVSRPLETKRTGRMTELLQAVQESARNYCASQGEIFRAGDGVELCEPGVGTNLGDKESHPLVRSV